MQHRQTKFREKKLEMLIKKYQTRMFSEYNCLEHKISEVENKIPNTSGLVTTTFLSTKINEVENKIPNHDKYITTPEFDKLTAENYDFDKKLTGFNRKITSNKTKYLEVQKKLNSLVTNDYTFFLGRMYLTSNDGSQNTFVYHPTLDMLGLRKDKGIDYVLSCKSNGVYNSKLKSLYTAFLHSIKLSGFKMGIKFDEDLLAVEENNYLTIIVSVYIVYDLAA